VTLPTADVDQRGNASGDPAIRTKRLWLFIVRREDYPGARREGNVIGIVGMQDSDLMVMFLTWCMVRTSILAHLVLTLDDLGSRQ
jgi:hypothetical protein